MKRIAKFLPLSAIILLTACSEDVKTVDYYSQHLDEAKQVITECKNDAQNSGANCKNAANAVSQDLKNKVFSSGIKIKKE
ncbi:EexN family lipoprotein [Vibrio owensii]|uniref:EexN family lipoprotein n=1 Tax=Vibrio owensii TaxID=696485 RepID=UPI0022DE1F03|nr:EexN family lipoprotein [Vibrio owensii]MDA0385586.1 EexN family lipoprotein [Vibrio owensii]